MEITLTINGEVDPSLSDYSVSEDSTPLIGGDTSGGIGQINASADTTDASASTLGTTLTVTDSDRGTISGIITTVENNDGAAHFTADSPLGQLVSVVTAQPQKTTLGAAFTYYLALCGITKNIFVDPLIASRAVIYPGWREEAWTQIKKMCIAERVEVAVIDGIITLRLPRASRADSSNLISSSWSFDTTQLAQSIEVFQYNTSYGTNRIVYPAGEWIEEANGTANDGWNSSAQVYMVDYGEILEFDIEINATLTAIQQPRCVSRMDLYYKYGSAYTVMANNAKAPMNPATWNKNGGYVKVTQKKNAPNTLTVRISSGGNSPRNAPYSIGMPWGGDIVSSLRIVGTGVFTQKQKLTFPTGLTVNETSTEIGVSVDNEFVSSLDKAYSVARRTLGQYSGLVKTVSGSVADMGLDFGSMAGARLRDGDNEYRIRTVETGPDQISYTAESDNQFSDHNTAWAGKTFGDFNTEHAGQTFLDHTIAPLKRIN